MPKATIKSKTGAIITIEGTDKEVSSILAQFENAVVISREKKAIAKSDIAKKELKKRMTASDGIVELREDGFFKRPKSLMEIATALEEKGYLYPVTTLSGVMIGLVKKKLVGRKKRDGKWVYGN